MRTMQSIMLILLLSTHLIAREAPQWEWVEIPFTINRQETNPYLSVEGFVRFRHDSGEEIQRPLFWVGGKTFKVRFASTQHKGQWHWQLELPPKFKVNSSRTGVLTAVPARRSSLFSKHGFWSIPKGSRQLVYRDGRSVILVADTAWALPWRATPEQVQQYAQDRRSKGFNAALLMTIQPDMQAKGPRDRTTDEGFAVAFEDLPQAKLQQINIDYFQELDQLMAILVEHDIVPVFQPVFHGYGWKGLQTAGNHVTGEDYARFCRYLVARYGAAPAIWLVGGDGVGDAPGLDPAGQMIEACDDYQHPTGMHYAPHGITDSFQAAKWLDFQWAQTGHNGDHLPEVAMSLYHQKPYKAVANGEPTYESMGDLTKAAGWWQGHEAWSNLCAGGTMGVVYGAGSLWNWRLHPKEPGHKAWTIAQGNAWYDALKFPGSKYVGILGKILNTFETTGMEPNWRIFPARRGLYIPDQLFILYLTEGGDPWIPQIEMLPRHYRIYDPKTGNIIKQASLPEDRTGPSSFKTSSQEPRVVIFFNKIP